MFEICDTESFRSFMRCFAWVVRIMWGIEEVYRNIMGCSGEKLSLPHRQKRKTL